MEGESERQVFKCKSFSLWGKEKVLEGISFRQVKWIGLHWSGNPLVERVQLRCFLMGDRRADEGWFLSSSEICQLTNGLEKWLRKKDYPYPDMTVICLQEQFGKTFSGRRCDRNTDEKRSFARWICRILWKKRRAGFVLLRKRLIFRAGRSKGCLCKGAFVWHANLLYLMRQS